MRKETTTRKLLSSAGVLAALLLWCLPYAAQAEGPAGYTLCANEGGTCTFSGKQGVAYGTGGRFAFREPTGSIACNNTTFGDPNPGNAKACYRTLLPPGNGWTQCANENGTCSVSGSAAVAYGGGTGFYERYVTGSIACNNATWGDPASGTVKACYRKDTGSCTAAAINPYLLVSGGSWQNTSSVTITSGQSVTFGPQPTDGTWSWSTGATTRQITVSPSSTTNYTATYRDTNGCTSSRVFTVTVNGTGSSSSSSSSGGGLSSILSRTQFEQMFPNRNAIFTYDALINAAASFPSFASIGTVTQRRQELSAFFGNIGHETTGGWPTAPGGPQAWGLYFAQEVGCENGGCTGYCIADPTWPCSPGRTYHGRGPMQLSYNFNYGPAGRAIGVDLLNNPDLVANNGVIAFKAAIWFWVTVQSPKPACSSVMNGTWQPSAQDQSLGRLPGFGMTINIINGGLECQRPTDARVEDRVAFYRRATGMFGVSTGNNLYCDQMSHY